jgi:hypothetical protein
MLLQLRVLRIGLLQDWDVWVGVFPVRTRSCFETTMPATMPNPI